MSRKPILIVRGTTTDNSGRSYVNASAYLTNGVGLHHIKPRYMWQRAYIKDLEKEFKIKYK